MDDYKIIIEQEHRGLVLSHVIVHRSFELT